MERVIQKYDPNNRPPGFDEIDPRDPVAFRKAKRAWIDERLIEQEMIKEYRERALACYKREDVNAPQNCRQEYIDYMTSYRAFQKKDWGKYPGGTTRQYKAPMESFPLKDKPVSFKD